MVVGIPSPTSAVTRPTARRSLRDCSHQGGTKHAKLRGSQAGTVVNVHAAHSQDELVSAATDEHAQVRAYSAFSSEGVEPKGTAAEYWPGISTTEILRCLACVRLRKRKTMILLA